MRTARGVDGLRMRFKRVARSFVDSTDGAGAGQPGSPAPAASSDLPDGGQLFILCLGGDDPVKANRLFAESQQAFDRWFKDKAGPLLKANFDQPLPPITRTLFDWHA